MAVSEADFADHAATIEQLFQEFHEWNKQGVVDSLGGHIVPVHEVKESYDIDSMIREDVAKLSDPEIYLSSRRESRRLRREGIRQVLHSPPSIANRIFNANPHD